MKKKITINIEWWFTETSDKEKDIKSNHQEALEESGMNRVIEVMKEGYTSGELHDNIHMDDNDTQDGIDYSGWWSINTETL